MGSTFAMAAVITTLIQYAASEVLENLGHKIKAIFKGRKSPEKRIPLLEIFQKINFCFGRILKMYFCTGIQWGNAGF